MKSPARIGGMRHAVARRDDVAATEALLAPMPEPIAAKLREELSSGRSIRGMRHDLESNTAFWVRADDKHVDVRTFLHTTFQQAGLIWANFDALSSAEVTDAAAARIYTGITGYKCDLVN
jgi:hypothetical protein